MQKSLTHALKRPEHGITLFRRIVRCRGNICDLHVGVCMIGEGSDNKIRWSTGNYQCVITYTMTRRVFSMVFLEMN